MLRSHALKFAFFIGLFGLLPHLLFSLNTGALHYATTAWDEDSYTGYLLTYNDAIYRILSNNFARFMHAMLGLDLAIITMDTFLPAISAFIAVMIAHAAGFREPKHWLLASALVLFPMEILAICHPYFSQEFLVELSPFASAEYSNGFRRFVPSIFQNFFSIYKSPEPQFTLMFHLGALYALLRYAQTQTRKYLWVLAVVAIALPFLYITTGISLLMFVGAYALLGLLITKQRRFIGWLIAGLLTAGYVVAVNIALHEAKGPGFLFHSRLPVLTASILFGVLGLWVIWRNWGFKLSEPIILAAAAFLVPIAALNQQIVTGVMVQSRSWEYYSNYPFVALGLLLVWPQVLALFGEKFEGRLRRSVRFVAPVFVILFIVAQFMSYKGYQKGDLVGLGYADGVTAAGDFDGYVLLDNPDHDSQTWLRLHRPDLKIIAGYQEIIKHPIPATSDANYQKAYDLLKDQAFTLFDRKGHDAHELQELIKSGIGTGGWYVRYFFSLLESWYPLSDFRNRDADGMLARIPDIVGDYQAFLDDPKRRNQFGDVLYLTETPIRDSRPDVPWVNEKVAMIIEGKWRQKTVYVYRQVPKTLEK